MKNVIPHLTANALTENQPTQEFEAAGLFMDISGFTRMTADLMKEGKEGAEVLSAILNSLFSDLIEAVGSRGGFIATFAGDAFTALFPGPHALAAAYAAREIQDLFRKRGIQTTRFGDFHLTVKVGLSFGQVQTGIVGKAGRRAFYFRGKAVDEAAAAEHHATSGKTVLGPGAGAALDPGDVTSTELAGEFRLLEKITRPEIEPPAPRPPDLDPKTAREFVPDAVLETGTVGEFRNVVSVFVALAEPGDHSEVDRLAGAIIQATAEYGGYCNSLDFGDKGCTMLLLFGAPVAHENDLVRAIDCALRITEELGQGARIGITTGTAYAGLLGSERRGTYTALGSVVNLSARLMAAANPGTIVTDGNLADALPASYQREALGAREYKGLTEAVETIRIVGRTDGGPVLEFSGNLVGRSTEVAQLIAAAAPLKERRWGGTLLLVGDPGSGKSRLLQEFASKTKSEIDTVFLPSDGVLSKSLNPIVHHLGIVFGTTSTRDPEERQSAFEAAFAKLLSELDAGPGADRAELRKELLRTKSLLGALLGLHEPGSLYEQLDPQRRFENTIIAIKDLFRAQSLIKPLCLAFDDVHWLEPDTQTLLAALSRNMEGFPVLIVASGRFMDDGAPPKLGLDSDADLTEIRLPPLPADDYADYVAAKLGAEPAPELVDFIANRAEGNPFYMEQFCVYLQKSGLLERNGVLRFREGETDLPTGVTSLLTARLDRLAAPLRNAVQAAAVLGRDFERELLGGMLGEQDPARLLMDGEREQIWAPEAGGYYRFRQTLLRDAAYQMQLKERLRELHARAAGLIESLGEDETRYADLAFHFEQANNQDRTHHYLRLAATYARDNYKNESALALYRKLFAYAKSDSERIDVYEQQSTVLDLLGRWDETVALLEKGIALSETEKLEARAAALKTHFGEMCQKRGQYEKAVQLLEEAAAIGHRLHDPKLEAGARTFLGRTRWSMGRYPEALDSLRLAIEIRRSVGDRPGLALSLYYAGVVDRDRGDYDSALARYEESLALFRESNDRMRITYPIYDMGVISLYRGKLDEALSNFEQANEIYEEIGYQSGASAALLNLGVIAARRGNLADAIAYYERSLATAEELGEHLAIAYAVFSIGTAYYQERDYDRTLHFFERAFATMKAIGARGYYGYVLSYLCCAYARMGQTARALKTGVNNLRIIAEVGSDAEHGRTNLGIALALASSSEDLGPNGRKLALEIAQLSGFDSKAEAHFERAIELSRTANFVTTLIPALREYATFLLEKNKSDERGRILLQEATRLAQESGMLLELALARRSAGDYGLDIKDSGD